MAERGTSDSARSHPEADAHTKHHEKESPGEKVQSHSVFNSIAEAIHPKNNDEKHTPKKHDDHQESSPSKKGFLHFHHHHPKHNKETHGRSDDIDENTPTEDVKGPNMFQRVKEEVEAVAEAIHLKKDSSPAKGSPHHRQHKEETHGRSDDIDELTSVDDVKGPNMFSRMKEEVEAVVEAIHPKKDKDSSDEHK